MKPKKIVGSNPTNAHFFNNDTFVDNTTKLFDDLTITPKGIRVKNLNRYQQPWDDFGYLKAVTWPLKILNPVQLGANILNASIGNKDLKERLKTALFSADPEKVILDNRPVDEKIQYTKSYIKDKIFGLQPYIYDLSNENVVRVTGNEKNLYSILANDFIETKTNAVRKAKDFVNTTDTIIGDKNKIPLSKIRTFYGVEGGKLKAGPLSTFDPETVVVPNRSKYVGKIKGIYRGANATLEFKDSVDSELLRYVNTRRYKPSIGDYLNSILTFRKIKPISVIQDNEGRDGAAKILDKVTQKYSYLGKGKQAYVITENNDTVPINLSQFNMTPKTLFADENGNALFVSAPGAGRGELKGINEWLQTHPSYPIMIDNGRYSHYLLGAPSYGIYKGFDDGNRMYAIGTTK